MTSMSQQVLALAKRLVVFDNDDIRAELGQAGIGIASTLRQRGSIRAIRYGVFGALDAPGAVHGSTEYRACVARWHARRDAEDSHASRMIKLLRDGGRALTNLEITKAIGYKSHKLTSQYTERGILIHDGDRFAYSPSGDDYAPLPTVESKPKAEEWSADHEACLAAASMRASTTAEIATATGLSPARVATVMSRLFTDNHLQRFPCLSGKQHHFYAIPKKLPPLKEGSLEMVLLRIATSTEPTDLWTYESHKLGDTTNAMQQLVAGGLVTFRDDRILEITPSGWTMSGIPAGTRVDPRLYRPRSQAILNAMRVSRKITTRALADAIGERPASLKDYIRITMIPAGGMTAVKDKRRVTLLLARDGLIATRRAPKEVDQD